MDSDNTFMVVPPTFGENTSMDSYSVYQAELVYWSILEYTSFPNINLREKTSVGIHAVYQMLTFSPPHCFLPVFKN